MRIQWHEDSGLGTGIDFAVKVGQKCTDRQSILNLKTLTATVS
jgi:hypothetical protein